MAAHDERINLRIAADELAEIDAECRRLGIGRSEYLRTCHRDRVARGPVTPAQLRALAEEMERG